MCALRQTCSGETSNTRRSGLLASFANQSRSTTSGNAAFCALTGNGKHPAIGKSTSPLKRVRRADWLDGHTAHRRHDRSVVRGVIRSWAGFFRKCTRTGKEPENEIWWSIRQSAVPAWGFGTGVDDFGLISTVATDSTGSVYVLSRMPKGVLHRFDPDGTWLGDWDVPVPGAAWTLDQPRRSSVHHRYERTRGAHLRPRWNAVADDWHSRPEGRAGRSRSICRPGRCRDHRAISMCPTGMARTGCIGFHADGTHILSWGGDGSGAGTVPDAALYLGR